MSEPQEIKADMEFPARSTVTLWIGVGVIFGLLAMAWAAMFFFANKHRPDEVPLEHREVG